MSGGRRSLTKLASLGAPVLAALLLSACAKAPAGFVASNDPMDRKDELAAANLVGGKNSPDGPKAYWGTALAKNPNDERAAVNYARALKAESKEKAMGVLQQAAMYNPDSRLIASEQGRLAVELGQIDLAEKLIARAEAGGNPDWRLISAKGTIAAKRGDKARALALFQEAQKLAPKEPSVLNNLALAYALNGEAAKGESLLKQARAAGGDAEEIRQNLAIVLGVQGKFDEARQLAGADLSKDAAAENVAYLQRLAKATPVAAPPATTIAATAQPAPAAAPASKLAAAKNPKDLRGTAAPPPAADSAWSTAVALSKP